MPLKSKPAGTKRRVRKARKAKRTAKRPVKRKIVRAKKNPPRRRRARSVGRIVAPRKTYRDAYRHTHKAASKAKQEEWARVYNRYAREGYSEKDAIIIANGVLKKQKIKRTERNPYHPYYIRGVETRRGRKEYWYFSVMGGFTKYHKFAETFHNLETAKSVAKKIYRRLPHRIEYIEVTR